MTVGIYHDKDLDGLACGAIMKKFIPGIHLIGWDYSYDHDKLIRSIRALKPDVIYMADITLPIDKMIELGDMADFRVFDHHEKAMIDILGYAHKSYNGDAQSINADYFRYSGYMSACELLWANFYTGSNRAIRLLGAYDTWRKTDNWDKEILPFQLYMRT